MILYPNAKVNLGLNIVGSRPDGYHDIETIFYPIPLQDALEVQVSAQPSFRLAGTPLDCAAGDNLVIKVQRMMQDKYQLPPLDIYLYKHIPSGAGLGGGSSDAAFMMRLLNEKFQLGLTDEEMESRLSALGADCAFFVKNKPVFATGIGNVFTPLELSLSGWTLVLVKPNSSVSTKEAYAGVKIAHPEVPLTELVKEPVQNWQGRLCNAFEPTVFAAHPEIAAIKDKLLDLGAAYASMSGSGSAVFGLFSSPLEHIEDEFAGCFVRQREL
ncbi:MAG: 4-(cytidine 5'-diphospho)-2-C-methyl-D-erythritol kinase [Bacteroidaceae bacterium]|nr:4-(cytidine 5'-diphospho)-2-C-methyl-D-erythritol kinase [Bacteroidaceae bacterium]